MCMGVCASVCCKWDTLAMTMVWCFVACKERERDAGTDP